MIWPKSARTPILKEPAHDNNNNKNLVEILFPQRHPVAVFVSPLIRVLICSLRVAEVDPNMSCQAEKETWQGRGEKHSHLPRAPYDFLLWTIEEKPTRNIARWKNPLCSSDGFAVLVSDCHPLQLNHAPRYPSGALQFISGQECWNLGNYLNLTLPAPIKQS